MNVFRRFEWKNRKISYAQCGEDLIISFIFKQKGISKPTYLDIGAHHPHFISNTFLFYKKGAQGVCIEPDPALFKFLQNTRKRDICLNVGVGLSDEEFADFYVMSSSTLNTFSEQEAKSVESMGNKKIEKILKIKLIKINDVMEGYFTSSPDFVSIDVEGLDEQIVCSIDFSTHRPKVFCIETLSYSENGTSKKNTNIIKTMQQNGYMLYADTYINSIFIENDFLALGQND